MSPSQALPSNNTKLQNLIDQCDFLQLSSSAREFPNSRGTGLPLLRLETQICTAVIALQGAHLLSFCAKGNQPLLWVSPNCDFTPGIALRGGVPVCLPWFGVNTTDPKKPKHGFARNKEWQLSSARLLPSGDAELIFTFSSPANALFDYDFVTQLKMTLGKSAKLEVTISNTDARAFDCSWVLHSYFSVKSLKNVRVKGLTGRTYLDNLENHAQKIQANDLGFPSEVDRVFPGIENALTIESSPHIAINHHNCPSVVVWNPGASAEKIADIGTGNEQGYVCVERGATFNENWHLAAGESKTAWMEFKEIIS